MPDQVSSKAVLQARIAKQLERIARLVPSEEDGDDCQCRIAGTGLATRPGWIGKLVADLVLLRSLDPLAALRSLRALDDRLIEVRIWASDPEHILDNPDERRQLYLSCQAQLASGDAGGMPDRIVALVTGDRLLDDRDRIPRPLLDALGREGRTKAALHMADLARADPCMSGIWGRRMTEILLGEPKVEDALRLIAQLRLQDQASATLVVERLLVEKAVVPEFLAWVRKVLREPAWEGDGTDLLIRDCVRLCDAEERQDIAQSIRREASPVLRDLALLNEWLDRLPSSQRKLEKARAMREIAQLEHASAAMRLLLGWLAE